MMRTLVLISCILLVSNTITAQPPKAPAYSVGNIELPAVMNKQVCISGMNYYNNQLYFASERCPSIFIFDPVKKQITGSIPFQIAEEFEMEGMTSYKDKLYLVSEDVAALYEVNMSNGSIRSVRTSIPLPPKTKNGDGMEGIAANEKNHKFYLLRERNEDMTNSQVYTFNVKPGNDKGEVTLEYESMFELSLDNPQWRYSDICMDPKNNRLLCLKSYSKGKMRQQYLESISIDAEGNLKPETLHNIPVDNFTEASNQYKDLDFSMNLEGISLAADGTIYIISDNTSGKALCDKPAREKTVLLELKKK
jgi:uncharacterized protein YjiK